MVKSLRDKSGRGTGTTGIPSNVRGALIFVAAFCIWSQAHNYLHIGELKAENLEDHSPHQRGLQSNMQFTDLDQEYMNDEPNDNVLPPPQQPQDDGSQAKNAQLQAEKAKAQEETQRLKAEAEKLQLELVKAKEDAERVQKENAALKAKNALEQKETSDKAQQLAQAQKNLQEKTALNSQEAKIVQEVNFGGKNETKVAQEVNLGSNAIYERAAAVEAAAVEAEIIVPKGPDFNDDTSIRRWGCARNETPFIFVHIGKAGGGGVRARFAAGALEYNRSGWHRLHEDPSYYYPVYDAEGNLHKGKMSSSRMNNFVPKILKEILGDFKYEGAIPCSATTPLGQAIACPLSTPEDLCFEGHRCDLINFGHNVIGG